MALRRPKSCKSSEPFGRRSITPQVAELEVLGRRFDRMAWIFDYSTCRYTGRALKMAVQDPPEYSRA